MYFYKRGLKMSEGNLNKFRLTFCFYLTVQQSQTLRKEDTKIYTRRRE